MMKPPHGSRNRLIRRLGRHANMTSLFRFSEAVQDGSARTANPGMVLAGDVTALPLARAFLPLPEPTGEADLPSPVRSPSAAPYASPVSKPGGSNLASARMEPPKPVTPGNVFREPEVQSAESPAAEEKSQPPEGEPVWNRLQNIFNQHKSKNLPQEAASVPQPAAEETSLPDTYAPVTEETSRASTPAGPELPAGNEPGTATSLTIQTKRETPDPLPVQPASDPAPGGSSEIHAAQAGQRQASVESSSAAAALSTDIIQAASESSPSTPLPSSTSAAKAAPVKAQAGLAGNETLEPSQSEQQVESLSQPRVVAPEPHVTNLQSLPLEAVWSVETVRGPQNPFPPAPEESDERISIREEIDRQGEHAPAEQSSLQRAVAQDHIVRNALQAVQPAQASDTGIEFIPPRRPRPVSQPARPGAPVTENSATPAHATAPQDALQRQEDTGPTNEAAEPDLVPTEIGPLPEDLWNLVGAATPPTSHRANQARPPSGETSMGIERSPIHSASPAASPTGPTARAPVVQRQVASSANAATVATPESESTPPAPGRDAVEGPADEEVNIEELARQVYSELKHRLGLEWERLRRR